MNWLHFLLVLAVLLVSGPRLSAAADREVRHGLKASVFRGNDFQNLICERIEPDVVAFFDDGAPADAAPLDHFSIRWEGWIRAPKKGRYRLFVNCDDGVRVWINGHRVINEWGAGAKKPDASVELTTEPQSIQVEYYEVDKWGWIVLMWQPLGVNVLQPIPPEAFYPDEKSAEADSGSSSSDKTGLLAEYFDRSFSRRLMTGRTFRTEGIWSDGAPAWGLPPNASARFTGFFVPPVAGRYEFRAWADGAAAIWIDGKPLVSSSGRKIEKAFVDLEANTPCPIRIDVRDGNGEGTYYLHWTPPKGDKHLQIPSDCLFQTKTAAQRKGT